MQTAETGGTHQGAPELGYMLLSIAGVSLAPLAIVFGNGGDSPFLFSTAMRVGHVLVYCAFLAATFRHILFRRDVLRLVVCRSLAWTMLFSILHRFEFVLFASATRFIDVSTVVMLFALQTVIAIILSSFLFERFQRITAETGLLLLVGLLGFCFIAAGEVGGFGNLGDFRLSNASVGILLAVLAAVAAALSVFVNRWGVDLSRALPEDVVRNGDSSLAAPGDSPQAGGKLEIGCVITGQLIGNLGGTALQGTMGFVRGESIAWESVGVAVACGIFATGLGTIAGRRAVLMANGLDIRALAYATPVVSLVWLYLFWEVDVSRYDHLAIGVTSIIAVNMLINFKAENHFGFKALVVALWSCGAFVYLRDDLLRDLPFGDWLWPGAHLMGVLGLAATVFILLLSFRVARLAARMQAEDDMIFGLFQRLDLLVRRGVVKEGIRKRVLAIDAAHSPEELANAYRQVRDHLSEAVTADRKAEDQARLSEAETQLNVIVHSRRHGVEFGELFALIIFAGITVLLALLARPIEVLGWAGFMFEVFAFAFSAVIIFLLVDVWDLHRDRTSPVLAEPTGDDDDYGVFFRDTRNRGFERGVSMVIGIAIAIAYAVLLWHKWLPATGL